MNEKILIALSDKNLVTLLSSELAAQGYKVSSAENGEEALQKMRTESPDLLLIDLVLNGKNGYDVLNEKTLDRLITKIPVIIVSNSGATVEMRKIPSTPSIKDYVIKSHVETQEVLEKVSAAFGRIYVSPLEANADKTSLAASSKPQHKKVLWVEDDKFLSMILLKKFESSGHTVLKASNGEEALKILDTEVPDVIVLDIMLPGMTGFDILQKIKMNEKLRAVPAIMLSNLSKTEDVEKAKTLGAQKFFVKAAISLDEIIREVDALTKI